MFLFVSFITEGDFFGRFEHGLVVREFSELGRTLAFDGLILSAEVKIRSRIIFGDEQILNVLTCLSSPQ